MKSFFVKKKSTEQLKADLSTISSYMELGVLLISGIQIGQVFFDCDYFNHSILLVGIIECVLYFVSYFIFLKLYSPPRTNRIDIDGLSTLAEHHNSFMLTLLVPLIFIFNADNTNYEHARLNDVELVKKAGTLLVLLSIGLYKLLPRLGKRLSTKIGQPKDHITLEQKKQTERLYYYVLFLLMLDLLVIACVSILYIGILFNNELHTNELYLIALLVALSTILLFLVNDEKKILRGALMFFIAIYSMQTVYNIYLNENVYPYTFSDSCYYQRFDADGGAYTDVYCRFETKEDDHFLSLCILCVDSDETVLHSGGAVYQFDATACTRGILRWYDVPGKAYTNIEDAETDEQPIVLAVSDSAVTMSEGFPFAYYLDIDNFSYAGADETVREWIYVTDNSIRMRIMEVEKSDHLTQTVHDIWAALEAQILADE